MLKVVATAQIIESSNLWPQIPRLVDFKSLFSIHPSTRFLEPPILEPPCIRWSHSYNSTTYLPGPAEGIHDAKIHPKKEMKIHPMMTESSHKKPAMFLPLDFAPIYSPIHFGRQAVEESLKQDIKGNEVLVPIFIWEKWLRFWDFDIFFLERFFLVNMWQFWCPTIVCNTYRCTMLKALLHWLHSKGKAAVFVLGCVFLQKTWEAPIDTVSTGLQ